MSHVTGLRSQQQTAVGFQSLGAGRRPSFGMCAQGSGTLEPCPQISSIACLQFCLPPRSLEPCLLLCLPPCLPLEPCPAPCFPPCLLLVSQLVSPQCAALCLPQCCGTLEPCLPLSPAVFLMCFPLLAFPLCLPLEPQLSPTCLPSVSRFFTHCVFH